MDEVSLSHRERNRVILKMLILGLAPPVLMVLLLISGLVSFPVNLFAPPRGKYWATYLQEAPYPVVGSSTLVVEVEKGKETRIRFEKSGSESWSGKVLEDGMHRLAGQSPYYTLFWLPAPHGIPVIRRREIHEVATVRLVDLTGFFGPVNGIYTVKLGEHYKNFSRKEGGYSIQDFEIVGENLAVAGVASYEVSTGLLLHATSFSGGGQRLSLEASNLPLGRFRRLLLPLVLLVAAGLAVYEMFWPVIRFRTLRSFLPPATEFAILGYCAVLLDVYLDYFHFTWVNGYLRFLLHFLIIVLFWARLNFWALLPLMELVLATVVLICNYHFQVAFAYFPATLAAWILAFFFQGRLSPGRWPDFLRFKVKF